MPLRRASHSTPAPTSCRGVPCYARNPTEPRQLNAPAIRNTAVERDGRGRCKASQRGGANLNCRCRWQRYPARHGQLISNGPRNGDLPPPRRASGYWVLRGERIRGREAPVLFSNADTQHSNFTASAVDPLQTLGRDEVSDFFYKHLHAFADRCRASSF